MTTIGGDDDRLIWSGAISLQRRAHAVVPWRIPQSQTDLFSPGDANLATRAEMPSGVRLRFATDAEQLTCEVEPMAEAANVDLYAGDRLVATAGFEAGATSLLFKELPVGEKVLELWLPQFVPFRLRQIQLPDGASLARREDTRPRWITYGSSITHCRTAASPSFTWPAVVARERGLNLTSLGFGGECHADPLIARLIRDQPADFVSVKIGINIYGRESLGPRAFRPAVLGTIATIRDGHPDIPLVVCSPIWCPARETAPNAVGMTLRIMREEIEAAVDSFRSRGDRQLYYVDGLKLFDSTLVLHLPDGLHPSAEGYQLMGANFIREVFAVQGVAVPATAAAAS